MRMGRRLVGTVTVALLLAGAAAGCATLEERREIDAEAEAADAALAAMSPADALLAVARLRDARRDAPELHRLALHRDPAVRAAALRGAALVGDPASLGALLAALGDADPTVRATEAWGLSELWAWDVTDLDRQTSMGQAEEALLDLLSSEEDVDVVRAAARALGEVGSDVSEDALWELVVRPDVRPDALLALAIRARRGATPPLDAARVAVLKAVAGDGPLPFEFPYLVARAGAADEDAGANLAKWLQERQPADDAATAWRLRAIGKVAPSGHPARLLLDWHLRGGDVSARVSALRGVRELGADGRSLLEAALLDAEPLIVEEAAAGLGSLGDEAALDALLAWTPDPDDAARRAIRLQGLTLWALAVQAPPPEAEPAPAPGVAAPAVAASHPRLAEAVAPGQAALADEAAVVRAAAYGLVGAWAVPEAVPPLLDRVAAEDDPGTLLTLALVLHDRPDDVVEGQLLAWLDGDDVLLGAVGAMGLATRDGAHVLPRLEAAYAARVDDPAEVERRLEIARALVGREDLPPDVVGALLQDPEPAVRVAAWKGLADRVGRAQSGVAPQQRELPDLPDASFGVGDVEQAYVLTSRGEMTFELLPSLAPAAVASFVALAEDGFFDGLVFHRVVLDFVIQGGDPQGTGWGGPGYTLREEFSAAPFVRGTLGMARSDKDTAGSQWFVCHSPQPHLDGHYTVFGQLVSGFETLDAIRPDDVIESVTIRRK